MVYAVTGSVDKKLREAVAALGQIATDFTSATAAGSTASARAHASMLSVGTRPKPFSTWETNV